MAATITRPAAGWAGRFTVILVLELDEPFDDEPTIATSAAAGTGATEPIKANRATARTPARRGEPRLAFRSTLSVSPGIA
jgi:hypothetical protein